MKQRFSGEGVEFNDEHAAIMSLSGSRPPARIVTTNYDDFLARTAKLEEIKIGRPYHASAFPPGHDFQGLLHLHGSVKGDAKYLVLDDRDFDRAYLTEGWAARFLWNYFRITLFYLLDIALMIQSCGIWHWGCLNKTKRDTLLLAIMNWIKKLRKNTRDSISKPSFIR